MGLESTDNSLSGVNRQETITDNFFAQTNIECMQLYNAVIDTVVSGNSCIGGNTNLYGMDISPAVGFLTVTGNIFVLPTLTNYAIKLATSTTAYYYFIEGNITNGSPVIDGGPSGAVKNVSNNDGTPVIISIPAGTATFATGTGVTSVSCASGYSCNNINNCRGNRHNGHHCHGDLFGRTRYGTGLFCIYQRRHINKLWNRKQCSDCHGIQYHGRCQ